MIRSLPRSRAYDSLYFLFILCFFLFLFAPLLITMVLAFNDSMFPALPWKGFTLDWFFGKGPEMIGLFHDRINLRGIATSFKVALAVSVLSTLVGTMAAFLFEQEEFRFKKALFFLMLTPLVIPGVILGISILLFTNTLGIFIEDRLGIYLRFMSPSFWLVVIGQFSFITTIVTLIISARLKKFDRTLEDAAMNLGATRFQVIRLITLRFLRPSIIGAMAIAFLMSFENFNTTLFLVGAESTLPINLYQQVRDGSTPVINAVSFLLIVSTACMAVATLYWGKKE